MYIKLVYKAWKQHNIIKEISEITRAKWAEYLLLQYTETFRW